MALIGDTIRLKFTFYSWTGALMDPTSIMVAFYTSNKTQIGTTVTLDATAKESTGVYHYDYTVPTGYRKIIYEINGTIDSLPSVERGEIAVTWK
jgi:hypothetical protein